MACERWVSESEADFRVDVLLLRYATKRNGLAELDRKLFAEALVGLDADASNQAVFDAMHDAYMDGERKTSMEDIKKATDSWRSKLRR